MNQAYLKGINSNMKNGDSIIFHASAGNIVGFLKMSMSAERSEIRTLDGKKFLTAIKGMLIDICPDLKYLEEKLKPLIRAVKEGKQKLPPVKAVDQSEVNGYIPPMPDWNCLAWRGCTNQEYERMKDMKRPKTLNYEAFGETFPMQIEVSSYANNGNLAIQLTSWKYGYPEPWSTLTVNLFDICEKNSSYVDTNNHGKKILNWILEKNLGRLTGDTLQSGYCVYPKVLFFKEKLEELDPEGYRKYEEQFA